MDIGNIQQVDIDAQMRTAYLDYAMSVIVARALPDARDGLKPVHRRILYAMQDMGIRANSSYKKSARIVGEVLGKYHPHGDAAVYESMARMAQDFSMRYLLVDGQGNFGSIDGDLPAAMRYTEARLHKLAEELLADIDKDTVDFGPNFDESLEEPLVLPARIPNLLMNGASGIAVGMATNIPPHNLRELVNAINFLIDKYDEMDDISVEELMKYVSGPDFPTGGIIVGREGIESAYGTGRGRIVVRGAAHIEEGKSGKHEIIITEIPYQVNKTTLIERIAELVREDKIDQIADLRDEWEQCGGNVLLLRQLRIGKCRSSWGSSRGQLLRRADVEGLAGERVDLRRQPRNFALHQLGEPPQFAGVDPHADALHARQDAASGSSILQSLRSCGLHRRRQLLPDFAGDIGVLLGPGPQLQVEPPARLLFQRAARGIGVQQEGVQHDVVLETGAPNAELVERQQRGLHVTRDLGPRGVFEPRLKGVHRCGRRERAERASPDFHAMPIMA